MLSLFLLLPLVAIIILNLPSRNVAQKMALWFGILLSVGQVFVVLFHPAAFWSSGSLRFFALGLQCDSLAFVLLVSIGIVVFTAVLVGRQTITEPKQWFNFINLVLVSLIGMNGTVLLTDVFSLYVFLEVTAIASFILIALGRDLNALEGAFKYLILSAVATVLMLSSVAVLLIVAGDTSFAAISSAVNGPNSGSVTVKFAIGIFICGLFIKGGLVPFHGWLPAAYSAAPAAVSILLAGIMTKVSGIYALIRLVSSVFGPSNASVNNILMVVGTVSILVGALAALGQNDFKKMLAYSSISQVGYIILGLGCGTTLGIVGAVFHLFNHSIFKTLLFVNSAAVEQRTGTTDMNRMGGLGAKMPFTSVTSLIAFLSTAGVPPMAGFWSKLIIIMALWQGSHYVYAFIAVLASVITLAYLLMMQRKVFFGILSDNLQDVREAGYGIVLPAVALAAITVAVGLISPLVFNSVIMPIGSFLK